MQYSNKNYKKFMLTFIMSVFFTPTLPSTSFASSDVIYDFGVQSESPVVSSTNPALMANCGSQIMSGINTRKVDFELESGEDLPGFSESEDKDYSFGSIYFGVCSEFLRWLSYGVFVNANALSFEFRTQNENNPLVFPYGKDGLPVASGGLAIKVIEPLSVGFAWKIVEKVDIDIRLPVELADALKLEIDADIRPD